ELCVSSRFMSARTSEFGYTDLKNSCPVSAFRIGRLSVGVSWFYDGELGGRPGTVTSGDILDVPEAACLQQARGQAGAVAAAAVNHHRFVRIQTLELLAQLPKEQVTCARQVPLIPLMRRAHVEQLEVAGRQQLI